MSETKIFFNREKRERIRNFRKFYRYKKYGTKIITIARAFKRTHKHRMLSITTARVSVLRGASSFVVNRSKKSVNRSRFGAKPSIRFARAASDDDDAKKQEEEEWTMGSDAKSNVVPRAPKLPGNAPEYMHGVLAFNRFYPENARGDAFNRHLVVALVSLF